MLNKPLKTLLTCAIIVVLAYFCLKTYTSYIIYAERTITDSITSPVVCGDGTIILFRVSFNTDYSYIYSYDTSLNKFVNITEIYTPNYIHCFSINDAGQRVVFSKFGNIYIYDYSTNSPQITMINHDINTYLANPFITSDGDTIYYNKTNKGNLQENYIEEYNYQNGQKQLLMDNNGQNLIGRCSSLSSSGNLLLFEDNGSINRYNRVDKSVIFIGNGQYAKISPDGRKIIYIYPSNTPMSNIISVVNVTNEGKISLIFEDMLYLSDYSNPYLYDIANLYFAYISNNYSVNVYDILRKSHYSIKLKTSYKVTGISLNSDGRYIAIIGKIASDKYQLYPSLLLYDVASQSLLQQVNLRPNRLPK